VANEIQKKYKNLAKARDDNISYSKKFSSNDEREIKKKSLVNTEKKLGYESKDKSQTYLKSTAAAELKASKPVTELSTKVSKIKLEQQQKIKEECIFQPRINTNPYMTKLEVNKEERLNRLYKSKTSEIQKREKLKQKKDSEEFEEKCTFHPQIEPLAQPSLKANYNAGETVVENRLFEEAEKRIEDQQKVFYYKINEK